ncbi:hypothetical protein [Streptomyces sp. NPDC055189]
MFIDQSGWRKRTLQGMAVIVGGACLGYLLFVGTLMSGLMQPVGTQPPSTNAPAPAGRDTGDTQRGSGTPARADAGRSQARADAGRSQARADAGRSQAGARADRHERRPPAGRTVPPAGGQGQ